MLKCFYKSSFKLYCGYCKDDLQRRIKEHKNYIGKKGAKSLRMCKGNIELVYYETYESKSDALKREYFIKKHLSRSQKLELIKNKSS